jgi:hypothetical protein
MKVFKSFLLFLLNKKKYNIIKYGVSSFRLNSNQVTGGSILDPSYEILE